MRPAEQRVGNPHASSVSERAQEADCKGKIETARGRNRETKPVDCSDAESRRDDSFQHAGKAWLKLEPDRFLDMKSLPHTLQKANSCLIVLSCGSACWQDDTWWRNYISAFSTRCHPANTLVILALVKVGIEGGSRVSCSLTIVACYFAYTHPPNMFAPHSFLYMKSLPLTLPMFV